MSGVQGKLYPAAQIVSHAPLRHPLIPLAESGCHSASPTVRAANENAVALYNRVDGSSQPTCGRVFSYRVPAGQATGRSLNGIRSGHRC
jgi:hypothetical protein